jgi:hypothetical protein
MFHLFSLGAFKAPGSTNWTMHQQQKVIKLSITFPLARRKNNRKIPHHIRAQDKKSVYKFRVSISLQTALRSLNTSPSACIEHMRKLLDQAWKTSTPDSLETRQEEIGTQYTGDRNTRPIQQPSGEKICGKKGYRMQMQITLEIPFFVYLLFRMAIPSSTCQIPFQHHNIQSYTSLWIVIKPRPKLLTNY